MSKANQIFKSIRQNGKGGRWVVTTVWDAVPGGSEVTGPFKASTTLTVKSLPRYILATFTVDMFHCDLTTEQRQALLDEWLIQARQ